MGVGRCHEMGFYKSGGDSEFTHCEETECVAKFCSLNLNSQIDGGDEVFGGQRRAVLCDDLEAWFARNKKNETGRFLPGTGFSKPAVA